MKQVLKQKFKTKQDKSCKEIHRIEWTRKIPEQTSGPVKHYELNRKYPKHSLDLDFQLYFHLSSKTLKTVQTKIVLVVNILAS